MAHRCAYHTNSVTHRHPDTDTHSVTDHNAITDRYLCSSYRIAN
jgi:hypothetical protein